MLKYCLLGYLFAFKLIHLLECLFYLTVGIVARKHYGYAHAQCYCGTLSMVHNALNVFRNFVQFWQ
jgi:hypothetical protein